MRVVTSGTRPNFIINDCDRSYRFSGFRRSRLRDPGRTSPPRLWLRRILTSHHPAHWACCCAGFMLHACLQAAWRATTMPYYKPTSSAWVQMALVHAMVMVCTWQSSHSSHCLCAQVNATHSIIAFALVDGVAFTTGVL